MRRKTEWIKTGCRRKAWIKQVGETKLCRKGGIGKNIPKKMASMHCNGHSSFQYILMANQKETIVFNGHSVSFFVLCPVWEGYRYKG